MRHDSDYWANKIADAYEDEREHPNPIDNADYVRWGIEMREQREQRKKEYAMKVKKRKEKEPDNGFLPSETKYVVYGILIAGALILVLCGLAVGSVLTWLRYHFC